MWRPTPSERNRFRNFPTPVERSPKRQLLASFHGAKDLNVAEMSRVIFTHDLVVAYTRIRRHSSRSDPTSRRFATGRALLPTLTFKALNRKFKAVPRFITLASREVRHGAEIHELGHGLLDEKCVSPKQEEVNSFLGRLRSGSLYPNGVVPKRRPQGNGGGRPSCT